MGFALVFGNESFIQYKYFSKPMYNLFDFLIFKKKFVLETKKYQLYDVYHSTVFPKPTLKLHT